MLLESVDYTTGQINFEMYMNVLGEVILPCLILADLLIMIPIVVKMIRSKTKIIQKPTKENVFIYIGLGLGINIITSTIITIILYTNNNELYKLVERLAISDNFILSLLVTGMLAPIMEELFFRYLFLEINKDRSEKFAIAFSALLFGLMHFNPIQSTYAFLIGLFLGYIYIKTKNLLYCIILHMSVNSSSVIYESLPHTIQVIIFLLALICSCIALYFYLKNDNLIIFNKQRQQ